MSQKSKEQSSESRELSKRIQKQIEEAVNNAFEKLLKEQEILTNIAPSVESVGTPLIEFESDATAPILRYDLPSPSSFEGKNYIELNDILIEKFKEEKITKTILLEDLLFKNRDEIKRYLSNLTMHDLEKELFDLDIEPYVPPEDPQKLRDKITHKKNRIAALETQRDAILANTGIIILIRYLLVALINNQISIKKKELKKLEAKLTQIEESMEDYPERPTIPEGVDNIDVRYKIFKYYLEIAMFVHDLYPAFYISMGGNFKIKFLKVEELRPRIVYIETLKMTNFPGDYGAGTVIKTFSLLPRESTEISIKTWKKSEETIKKASSVLDSYTEEKANEFENSVQAECARSSKIDKASSYHVKASASANWGWGSASVSGGTEGSVKSSREESAKNVMSATAKNSQRASASREVSIDTEHERREEEEEETVIMRSIRNLNVTRTLNFTFRQMNQEYHSILHLVDLRLGFYNGYPGSLREYALCDIGHFVYKYIKEEFQEQFLEELKNMIKDEYGKVYDYYGKSRALIEEFNPYGEEPPYLRVKPPLDEKGEPNGQQKYIMRPEKRDDQGNIIQKEDARFVDGIILSNKILTMKTDGVIVEALMGKVNALDDYSYYYRIEKIRKKKMENERIIEGLNLVKELLKDKKYDQAVIAYKQTFGVEAGIEALKNIFSLKLETLEKS